MTSLFWNNVSARLESLGKSQKRLAEMSNVGKTVINSGITRKSSPSADNAYAIARVFEVSIEELLDNETGASYIQTVSRNDPRAIQVPDRIYPIVKNLLLLEDRDLTGILASTEALAKDKKGTPQSRISLDGEATGTDG
jgi:transcriptional regulator with XRE-family HTH domain